ncbi:hypothetical protein FBU30_000384 [Linnemannia zychae]|nr:hypothetical protein FBU30_000384 [Linnemannia zychae]
MVNNYNNRRRNNNRCRKNNRKRIDIRFQNNDCNRDQSGYHNDDHDVDHFRSTSYHEDTVPVSHWTTAAASKEDCKHPMCNELANLGHQRAHADARCYRFTNPKRFEGILRRQRGSQQGVLSDHPLVPQPVPKTLSSTTASIEQPRHNYQQQPSIYSNTAVNHHDYDDGDDLKLSDYLYMKDIKRRSYGRPGSTAWEFMFDDDDDEGGEEPVNSNMFATTGNSTQSQNSNPPKMSRSARQRARRAARKAEANKHTTANGSSLSSSMHQPQNHQHQNNVSEVNTLILGNSVIDTSKNLAPQKKPFVGGFRGPLPKHNGFVIPLKVNGIVLTAMLITGRIKSCIDRRVAEAMGLRTWKNPDLKLHDYYRTKNTMNTCNPVSVSYNNNSGMEILDVDDLNYYDFHIGVDLMPTLEIQRLNAREATLSTSHSQSSSWHEQYKDSAYIFVGGLPYHLTEGDVICVVSQFGEVAGINLVRDKDTGKSKGYAFLKYVDQRSTILAVDNLNGAQVAGRTIRVDHVQNYKVPKVFDAEGNEIEADEETINNAAPKPIQEEESDEDESSESEVDDTGIDIDDPMREYLLKKRKKEARKVKRKAEKEAGGSGGKSLESKAERKARKELKKAAKREKDGKKSSKNNKKNDRTRSLSPTSDRQASATKEEGSNDKQVEIDTKKNIPVDKISKDSASNSSAHKVTAKETATKSSPSSRTGKDNLGSRSRSRSKSPRPNIRSRSNDKYRSSRSPSPSRGRYRDSGDYRRRDRDNSRDRVKRDDSRDRSRKNDSGERRRRDDSWDRSRRDDSRERRRRDDSRDRDRYSSRRRSPLPQYSRHNDRDRGSRHRSRSRSPRRDSRRSRSRSLERS